MPPRSCHPSTISNTRRLLNSNIQYQFLKYNGFKPMSVPACLPHYSQDKLEHNINYPEAGLSSMIPTERYGD